MPYRFDDVWVAEALNAKLNSKHGVSLEEVAEVLASHDLTARWQSNQQGVEYLMCRGVTAAGRGLAVVLYPVGKSRGSWRLATAYPDPGS